MATDFKSIPIIDISPLLEKWDDPNMGQDKSVAEVVRQLDKACREAGFFYVKGHNIPNSLVKEVRAIARQFFYLPEEEKLKIKLSPSTGYRGYQHVGENLTEGVPDRLEAIDCYTEVQQGMYGDLGEPLQGSNIWPSHPPNFQKLMEEYIDLCTGLSRKIMRGIGLALGGSAVEFEGELAGDPFWEQKIIGYPAASSANGHEIPKNGIGCGAHTDYGLLTLVNQDDSITALEVRNKSGEWISAPPIPGTFVCNIGDMLKTNYEAAVEPLTACIEQSGGTRKFDRAVYGEYLVSKVRKSLVFLENSSISYKVSKIHSSVSCPPSFQALVNFFCFPNSKKGSHLD